MKQLVLLTFFAVALVAQSQDNSGPAAKLRADLSTAVKNANLTDAQKETLQDAASRLRAAAEARKNGDKVDRGSVKKALSEIEKVAKSGAFRPEDAAAVKADLEAIQEARGRSRRGRFRS